MEIHTTLVQDDLARVPDEIRRIESAGYDGVMTQENRHDRFCRWRWPRLAVSG